MPATKTKPATETEVKPAVEAGPKRRARAAAKPATETKPKGRARAATQPGVKAEPKSRGRAAKAAPEVKVAAESKPEAAPPAEAVTEAKPEVVAEAVTESTPEVVAEAAPESAPEVKAPAATAWRVDRDEFAQAVTWIARSLPSRPSVPVLAGIRLDLAGGELRLSAFDYEVSAEAVIPAESDSAAQLLLPGKVLAEIAQALPAQPVDFTVDGVKVIVACGAARFTLLTMPVEDYPTLPEMPPVAGRIDAAAFAAAAAQVVIAAGKDETLPMLTGIHVRFEGEKVTLAATDRFRLAVRELTWQPPTPNYSATLIAPARVLSASTKSLVSAGEVEVATPATGTAGDELLGLSGAGRRTTTRLLGPVFPDYPKLIPTEFPLHVDLDAAAFTEAVKRVALVADRNTPIRLSFADGQVAIEAGGGDTEGVEKVPVTWDGEPFSIAFNHGFLLDGIGAASTSTVRLQMTSDTLPAVLVEVTAEGEVAPGYTYLIMPIRLS